MNIKNIGFIVLILAAVLLIGNGIYHLVIELFIDTEISLIIKVGIFGIIIGIILLIIGLIIERIKDKKDENF
ncbi:MAG: hypothetical protein U5K53_02960 [Halanaerobiales bacterium]|nr:hypothetical protein [Halanaerobiales bacterium]